MGFGFFLYLVLGTMSLESTSRDSILFFSFSESQYSSLAHNILLVNDLSKKKKNILLVNES